ncbi:MAG: Rieske (2Fe-2S) protein [Candidatus Neomarinimicrobiota bacterium]|nr:Rieske (2Fe-2S) protein [Candidatus Neomarinimicrobiota bacterium]
MASRRQFMRTACGTATAALCGGISLSTTSCSPVPSVTPEVSDKGLSIPVSALAENPSVIVKRGLAPPIVVHRSDLGNYTALLLSCTHKACRPEVFEYSLDCPCHGSQFDFDGRVLSGPAEQDLQIFHVTEDGNGNLFIALEQ